MATQVISTVADALDVLQKLDDPTIAIPAEINFEGNLAVFKVVITGDHYHGTVPGELARGIWEYQEAIYRAVAFALYDGPDPDDLLRLRIASTSTLFMTSK